MATFDGLSMKMVAAIVVAFAAAGCKKADASDDGQSPAAAAATTTPPNANAERPTTVTVTTFAGSGKPANLDGTGAAAEFYGPSAIAIDASGNLYVADGDDRIRKITSAGVVTTLAGGGSGYQDGPGASAKFSRAGALTVDASGNVYVADAANNRIRKITPDGNVVTLAGSAPGYKDGNGAAAQLDYPRAIAVDASGNVFVLDRTFRIRKITQAGAVTTFAGSGAQGDQDGIGTAAQFNIPGAMAIDASGNLFVADGNKVRKITPSATVTTVGISGVVVPFAIAVDGSGNIYLADGTFQHILKSTKAGAFTSLAGGDGMESGDKDGAGADARFNFGAGGAGLAVDARGNVYVADHSNNRIRKITQ